MNFSTPKNSLASHVGVLPSKQTDFFKRNGHIANYRNLVGVHCNFLNIGGKIMREVQLPPGGKMYFPPFFVWQFVTFFIYFCVSLAVLINIFCQQSLREFVKGESYKALTIKITLSLSLHGPSHLSVNEIFVLFSFALNSVGFIN
jgi:hypothetical protein